jgi:vacuolar-type H+-ATPase subunit E/Vma4
VPLDDLLQRLEREAVDQSTALIAAARDEAKCILREAEESAMQDLADRLAALTSGHQAETAKAIEAVRLEGALALLRARHQAIDRILDRVRSRLTAAAADPGYLESVVAELDHALAILDQRPAVLHASPAIADLARHHSYPNTDIVVDPALAGFRLSSVDGRITVDATLAERLRLRTPALGMMAAQALEAAK